MTGVLPETESLKDASYQSRLSRIAAVSQLFRKHKYMLAALIIPLTIRAIPEIVAGPYPIGYDTISSYVPAMLDWKSGDLSGFHPMIGGWLVVGLLGSAYLTTHVDPILIVKSAGPLLYGL